MKPISVGSVPVSKTFVGILIFVTRVMRPISVGSDPERWLDPKLISVKTFIPSATSEHFTPNHTGVMQGKSDIQPDFVSHVVLPLVDIYKAESAE